MKNLFLLVVAVFMVSSCSDEEKSSETRWEAVSLTVDASPIPIVLGISLSPDFITKGEDFNYELILDSEDMSWAVNGDYTLRTIFENRFIPEIVESFTDKSKSGSYLDSEAGLQFDDSLYDIEINGLLWSRDDGSPIKFTLNESGDRLIQDQLYTNINVNSDMKAILQVITEWKRK